jgi:hypothetical protein
VQFDALWSSTSKSSSDHEAPEDSTSKGCEICYKIDLNTHFNQGQPSKVEQVLVESCDETIEKENDHLKIEVKTLELEVNKLKKQAKVQHSQDNCGNMLKKLEKGTITPKVSSQHQSKQNHHKKEERNHMDDNVKYARSGYLNARRPHIKSAIGYKTGDKHNSRVITGQEFIKFTKANIQQENNQNIKATNNASYAHTNAPHISLMSYHDFDASYVLMRNKFGRVITLHIRSHHKRSNAYVWVPKCIVTNLKGLNQTWVPKNKA